MSDITVVIIKVLAMIVLYQIPFGDCILEDVQPGNGGRLKPKPTYLIIAPKRVRPTDDVQIIVSVYDFGEYDITVRAIIRCDDTEVVSVSQEFQQQTTKTMQMKMPEYAKRGNYTIRVEATASNAPGGYIFFNETKIDFHPKYVSLFIQTDKWLYQKKQKVAFRIVALTQRMTPVKAGSINIYFKNSRGRILQRWLQKQLRNGYCEGSFSLSHPISYGWWTIQVEGFGYIYYQKFKTENVYRERFDINLTAPAYVRENEYAFAGIMHVNSTSGYPMKGNASAILRIKPPNTTADLPALSRTIPYFEGVTSFQFPLEELRNISSIKPGTELQLSVEVQDFFHLGILPATTKSEILSSDIHIKVLGGRVRTFKPRTPFFLYVALYESDGSPFSRMHDKMVLVQTSIISLSGHTTSLPEEKIIIPDDGIVRYIVTPGHESSMMKIRISHGDGNNKNVEVTASRFYTRSGHYLSITSSTEQVKADKYMVLTVRSTVTIPELTYLVATGDRIVTTNQIYMTSRQKTFSFSVSRHMAPHSRIIIYGMLPDGEVLTDSLSFYVHGIRNQGVEVRMNKGKDFSFNTIEMTGTTDPGTLIAFSVMDYDFYKRGGNREREANIFFTTYAIEEEYLSYNDMANASFQHTWFTDDSKQRNVYFHSQGFAIDTNTSFVYNGLGVMTDAYLSRIIGAWTCNSTMGYLPCFDGSCYLATQGCDGVRQCSDGADEMGCPDPLVVEVRRSVEVDRLYRIWPHLDDAQWGWKNYYTKPDGRIDFRIPLPSRPTTWVVGAFSLHTEYGLAFNENPVRVDTTRPFYIVLESQSKAVRGEQLGMQVVLFNYYQDPIEALVTLAESKDYAFINVEENGFASSYSPNTTRASVQTMVYMKSGESRMVHFPIVSSVEIGKFTVNVAAYTFIGKAVASKSITMRMDGVTNVYHTPYLLDLVSQGSIIIPDLEIPVREMFWHPEQRAHLYVPGSEKASVTLVGDVLGPGFTSSHLSGQTLSGFFEGNGVDYIFNLAYNLNMLKFLKLTNQINKPEIDKVLEGCLKDIFSISSYILPDGGFSIRRKRANQSIWMTSYALETLAAAADPEWEDIIFIDVALLNKMAKWLLSKQDAKTGAFPGMTTEYYDIKMKDNVTDSGGNLLHLKETAYVVIGISKALSKLTGKAQSDAESARNIGAQHIGDHFGYLTDPFDVCLATYALHISGHKAKGNAFRKMQSIARHGEYMYWSSMEIFPDPTEIVNTVPFRKPRPMASLHEASAVQATAYALMVYLRNNHFIDATTIMHWLQSQRRNLQFFGAGHDTIVAMQALRDYGERITNRDIYNMRIRLEATSTPSWKRSVNLQRGSFHAFHSFSIPNVYGSVKVSAMGTGVALLQMRTEVNVEYPWLQRKPLERSFDLNVENVFFYGRNASNFHMTVCLRWARPDISPVSGSAILQVDIPTGFVVRKNVLRAAQKETKYRIKRARFTKQAVVLYFNSVGLIKQCDSFTAERWYPVANGTIQHLVRVWDSFNTALQNISLYNTYDLFHLHICQVCGSFQCPYCPYYNGGHQNTMSILIVIITLSITKWPLLQTY